MVKKSLSALALFAYGSAASAQSFPVPNDILQAGHWGSDGWNEQPITYEAGSVTNAPTSGAAANIPATAYEFAELNPIDTTGWELSNVAQCLTIYEGGTCNEAKVRFTISGFSHALKDDPIRNFNLPGTSHLHCFFGNASTNAVTTYASLRNRALKSRAGGGPMNATAYWVPCMVKQVGGVNYVVKSKGTIIIYYEIDPAAADNATWLLLGLRYVTGWDMDNTAAAQYAWLQSKLDVANAQPGTSGRYTLTGPGGVKGYGAEWKCNNATSAAYPGAFAGPNGEDAFAGTCNSGDDFWIQFRGASCWDRINFWSPGGYKHVIPSVYDNYKSTFVCPKNYAKIPDLQFQIHYPQAGIADRATMRLASDPTTGQAKGLTFHTDWLNGWQRPQLRKWLNECIGIQNTFPSRECGTSANSNSTKLVTDIAAPTGRTPQVQAAPNSGSSTDITKMWRWGGGTGDVHVHGN